MVQIARFLEVQSIVQMDAYHVRSVSLPCRSHPLLAHLCTHIAARGAQDCRKADTNAVVVLHQSDAGEYLRKEEELM